MKYRKHYLADPREPLEWSDLSDYPQDGWGNVKGLFWGRGKLVSEGAAEALKNSIDRAEAELSANKSPTMPPEANAYD